MQLNYAILISNVRPYAETSVSNLKGVEIIQSMFSDNRRIRG